MELALECDRLELQKRRYKPTAYNSTADDLEQKKLLLNREYYAT